MDGNISDSFSVNDNTHLSQLKRENKVETAFLRDDPLINLNKSGSEAVPHK